MDGFGSFEYGVQNNTGNSSGHSILGPLTFTVQGTGLTIASFASNSTGGAPNVLFAVDIYSPSTGNTGPLGGGTCITCGTDLHPCCDSRAGLPGSAGIGPARGDSTPPSGQALGCGHKKMAGPVGPAISRRYEPDALWCARRPETTSGSSSASPDARSHRQQTAAEQREACGLRHGGGSNLLARHHHYHPCRR